VKCGEEISEDRAVHVGVPQGSVLGTLLFALYANDLSGIFSRCKCHLFADDTVIFIEGDNIVEMVNVINIELKEVSNWFAAST